MLPLQAHSEPAYITRGKEIERLAREAAERAAPVQSLESVQLHTAEQSAHPQPSRLQVWGRRVREAGEVAHHAAPVMEVGTYQTGPTIIRTGAPVTTMSSREIAELTGKQHKDVLYDIRNMLVALERTSAEFSANLPDAYGRPQVVFNLPKDLTITLVSGYNVTMRHRIVTRWMELEEAAKPAAPVVASSDPLYLLLVQAQMFPKLIAEMQEQKRAQAAQARALEVQAEKLAGQQPRRCQPLATTSAGAKMSRQTP